MPKEMYLKSLSLISFRNYQKKSWQLSGKTTLLVGDNAVGKTNILEAIYLLATGKSFRASREDQMILYGAELAKVSGEIEADRLEILLTTGEVAGQRVQKKKFLVNGLAKRKMDFTGKLRCVLFRPEDIELVLGSPAVRRNYLDQVLEQVDREYRRSILSYNQGVRQRNKLLERIRENQAEAKQLLFWNKLLIKNGGIISVKRGDFLEYVNEQFKLKGSELQLVYDSNAISEVRLVKYAENEVWAGKTLVGPHRDDFSFISQRKGKQEKNLNVYGSRGEQRMAVLQIKLAELEYVQEKTSDNPVLLLDDIFSELDEDHRQEVFDLLDKQQTIVTTTDEQLIPKKYLKKIEIVKL